MVSDISATLEERQETYGDFESHASVTQGIKREMSYSKNWQCLSEDKKECLEMVAHKIGRILNGDPDFHDSWHDIIGYVTLVERNLRPNE